jgi:membrane fusion protein (multidrug efflux system)
MRSVTISVLVIFALAALASASGCRESTSQADAALKKTEVAIKVETLAVSARPVPQFITLTGSLIANRASQVASDGTGKVTQTFVERGTLVTAGAPLLKLDARTANLSAAEARAQVQAARSLADRAKRDCSRAKELLDQSAINQAEFDRMTADCQGTAAQAEAALAREDLASKAIGDAIIRAPFAGIVDSRSVDVGEYVHAGNPVATVVEIDPLRLQLTVPETYVGKVSEGQKVEFEVAAYSDETRFQATVKYVSAAMRTQSRDLLVEAVVENKNGKLRPGMFAVAHLIVGELSQPVIPLSAVRQDSELARAFTIHDGRAEEHLVQLGRRLGSDIVVLSGLKVGDKIIAKMTDDVRDGVKVE